MEKNMPYTHPIRSVPEHAHTLALEIDAQCKKVTSNYQVTLV